MRIATSLVVRPVLLALFFCIDSDATELREGQSSFEFHGYFRGGLGFSEPGETQGSFKGLVGNTPASAPYADETEGWSIGSQVEAWW